MKNEEENILGLLCGVLTATVVIFGVFYLSCSFYSTTFDISQWTSETRFICALFGTFCALFISYMFFIYLKK